MKFGKKTQISSLALDDNLVSSLYDEGEFGGHKTTLNSIVKIFEPDICKVEGNFTCFVEKLAMDAFEKFANEVYGKTRNEATGVIVGYYLHDKDHPEKKIIVATNFLQATGSASNVTCEFSYEDSIRHARYCDANRVYPVIWIHSHPGFGVFYSSTDSSTLRNYFGCNHQMGIVVDNLQKRYLGFKIYEGEQFQQEFFVFDIQKCLAEGHLICERYDNSSNEEDGSKKKKTISYKELNKPVSPSTNRNNPSVSFQFLQKLSSQLSTIEKGGVVDNLKNSIQELSRLLNELRIVSYNSIVSSKQYGIDDIKDEITIQIKDLIKSVGTNISSLKAEYQSIQSIHSEIQSLKNEFDELKKSIISSSEHVGFEERLDEIAQMFKDTTNKSKTENLLEKSSFIKSFKQPINLRDISFICLIIGMIIFYIFSLIFSK